MCPEPSDLTNLVLGPDTGTIDSAGRIDVGVEAASDGRANVKIERNVGVTDASREGPRRSEITKIVIGELGVATSKLGDGSGEASGYVVQDLVDGERAREPLRGSRNGVDESFGSMRHW
jgi:hypothetical protein